jgi:hypothetical protein
MTAAPKIELPVEVALRGYSVSQATPLDGETDAFWEETSRCTGGKLRGTGPGHLGRSTGNNVGKGHLPAGIGDNLQRCGGIGTTEAAARVMVRRMGSYERASGGNSPRGGRRATTVPGNARGRAKEPWDLAVSARVKALGTDPGLPVHLMPERVCRTRPNRRGVCAPTLESPGCTAGRRRKARPPNRTRGIRPSGMTTGARGNVAGGRTANPPRGIAEDST